METKGVSIMTRISKTPAERKNEILDAAMELFLTKGYQNTSVSDIVQQINVAQGLFYYYFKSKDEVFRAVLERLTDEFAAKLIAIIQDGSLTFKSRLEKISEVSNNVLPMSDSAFIEEFHQAEFMDMHTRLSLHVARALIEPIANLLEEMNGRKIICIKDPQMTSAFLVFGIFGLIHGEDDHNHNRDYLKPDILLDLISRLLGVSPEVLSNI